MSKSRTTDRRNAPKPGGGERFTLGREGMKTLNAVEGIAATAASERMFREFDERGVPADERRRAIRLRHAGKA